MSAPHAPADLTADDLYARMDKCREAVAEIARLRAANADLLALAKQFASECGECSGLGYSLGLNAEHVPCPDCASIRAVIARTEGRS